jgi:hypothetical protein
MELPIAESLKPLSIFIIHQTTYNHFDKKKLKIVYWPNDSRSEWQLLSITLVGAEVSWCQARFIGMAGRAWGQATSYGPFAWLALEGLVKFGLAFGKCDVKCKLKATCNLGCNYSSSSDKAIHQTPQHDVEFHWKTTRVSLAENANSIQQVRFESRWFHISRRLRAHGQEIATVW